MRVDVATKPCMHKFMSLNKYDPFSDVVRSQEKHLLNHTYKILTKLRPCSVTLFEIS